jgi:peptidoglycan/xylan/chitin deacetylase (PgdA/CDA1 family)
MIMREATFARLLAYLQARFHVISLETFLQGDGATAGGSKPCCLLTFDDGWRDTYTTAYPLLRKFGMPAVVFVATGVVGSKGGFWEEQLRKAVRLSASDVQATSKESDLEIMIERLAHMPAEKRQAFLAKLLPAAGSNGSADATDRMSSWSQVIEMSRDGVEIGAHSVSHPLLTYERGATLQRELSACKAALENAVGKPVRAFAYPYGDWDERVRRRVEQSGYDCAFITLPGWHERGRNRYTIRRILLHEGCVTNPNGAFSAAMLELTLTGWR